VNHLYTRIARASVDLSKFEALREIKSVVSNIPPHLNKHELEERLKKDKDFRDSLSHRLVRLFGIRNDFIPNIEAELIDLIDNQLGPLFLIENGKYDLMPEKLPEFVAVTENLRSLVAAIETKYMKKMKEK
jgi:hypothetical protein